MNTLPKVFALAALLFAVSVHAANQCTPSQQCTLTETNLNIVSTFPVPPVCRYNVDPTQDPPYAVRNYRSTIQDLGRGQTVSIVVTVSSRDGEIDPLEPTNLNVNFRMSLMSKIGTGAQACEISTQLPFTSPALNATVKTATAQYALACTLN